jgi:F-type H+-transporting ATPase subunit beta
MPGNSMGMEPIGRVIAVQGPVVDVRFDTVEEVPSVYSVIKTKTVDDREIFLEVAEHQPGNIARCIAIHSTQNLQRNAKAIPGGTSIEIPVGDGAYSRIMNVIGRPVDQKGPIESKVSLPIRTHELGTRIRGTPGKKKNFEVLETGIKIIDLLFPLVKGSKTGVLGGAGLGKSLITLEIIHNIVKRHQGSCVFVGIGERIREGNELYFELKTHGLLAKTMMVFGQMN